MDGNSVTLALPPSREEIERFARWALANGIVLGRTFSRGRKDADKKRAIVELPTELGAATGFLASWLQDANIILPGAASSLFLVDGDLPWIVEAAKRIGGETFEFRTGRGRTNLVYRAPEGSEFHVLRWKDKEERLEAARDGYLVAPLSVHPETGELYVQTNDLPPTELSADQVAELVALAGTSSLPPSALRTGSASPLLDRATGPDRSSRHDADYDEACRLWRLVRDEDASVELVLRDLRLFSGSHAKGSRSNAELRKDVRRARVYMRETGNIGADIASGDPGTGDSASGERRLSFTRATDVAEKPPRFFVRPFLQESSFTIYVGRKGAGKGTELSRVGAEITRGDHGPKRGILWLSSEDSNAQDIVPRFAVADADLGYLYLQTAGWLELPRDIPELAEYVRELGNVGLVVIDPLGNHITGKDSNQESDIRAAIGPLNGFADELGVAVVGIRHLTEKSLRDRDLLAGILGSSAFVQVPRAIVGIVEDDEDDDVRHVAVVRGNRLPKGQAGHTIRIEGVPREGYELDIPRAVVLGDTPKSLDDLLRGSKSSKSALAREALLEELASRPEGMESDALDELVAKRSGLSERSVRNLRSKSDLVRSVPIRNEVGGEVERWTVVLSEAGLAALGVVQEED